MSIREHCICDPLIAPHYGHRDDCPVRLNRERALQTARETETERLTRQLAGAVDALKRYGGHDMRCTMVTDDYAEMQPPRCSCGYSALLHRLGGQ